MIDCHLNWSFHTKLLATKLSRANGMLAKIRHYVNNHTLRSIYFSIFSSLLTYSCQIWGQQPNVHIKRIIKLQNKALRIINFADFQAPSSQLYKSSKILKLQDLIKLKNFLYVYDCFTDNVPTSINGSFAFVKSRHDHMTRIVKQNCVNLPISKTINYGIHSIKGQSARHWNSLRVSDIHHETRNKCKQIISLYFFNSY